MKSFKDAFKSSSFAQKIKPAGSRNCKTCGNEYKVYETPFGVQGACKTCSDNELKKGLPFIEDLQERRERNFIEKFERVPWDLQEATVNSFKPDSDYGSQGEARNLVARFIQGFSNNEGASLVLSGSPGLGKSHLAYAAARALKNQNYKVLYIKASDLLEYVRGTFSPKSELTETQIFDMISGLDLLVMDDVGAEYVKMNDHGYETWVSDVLCKVFDLRLNKPVICTTNYTERELATKYGMHGNRITSRMLQNAKGIRMEGKDRRKREDAF